MNPIFMLVASIFGAVVFAVFGNFEACTGYGLAAVAYSRLAAKEI